MFYFAALASFQKHYIVGLLLILFLSSAPFKTTKSLPVRIEVAVSISIGILVGLALVTGLIKYYACRKKRLSLPEG